MRIPRDEDPKLRKPAKCEKSAVSIDKIKILYFELSNAAFLYTSGGGWRKCCSQTPTFRPAACATLQNQSQLAKEVLLG